MNMSNTTNSCPLGIVEERNQIIRGLKDARLKILTANNLPELLALNDQKLEKQLVKLGELCLVASLGSGVRSIVVRDEICKDISSRKAEFGLNVLHIIIEGRSGSNFVFAHGKQKKELFEAQYVIKDAFERLVPTHTQRNVLIFGSRIEHDASFKGKLIILNVLKSLKARTY
ncbi:hypothetical protein Tco_0316929 [Tanacetum coccineum]